jgi:hypothetical protein
MPLTPRLCTWALLAVAVAARADEPTPEGAAAKSADDPTTGALRLGIYADNDQTTVLRSLATVAARWGNFTLGGSGGVDIVSSASLDVRTSPALSRVDVVTSASGRSSTSGGKMSDKRVAVTSTGGWNDGSGHVAALTTAFAAEADYVSVSGGMNGSFDVLDRTTTFLGGFTVTQNWVASVLDRRFRQTMHAVAWSGGIAQVLTPDDALRLRYDGAVDVGYQASPYRNVRFGDWTTAIGTNHQILFMNTIGSPDGLPENEPETRVRHAVDLEWVHALGDVLGLHSNVRVGADSWGVESAAAALDLRAALPDWRLQLGYRLYLQTAADFFEDKYTQAPSSYVYYASDKELGREVGHIVNLDVSAVLRDAKPGGTRLLLDARLAGLYYRYPGFVLLTSRASVFAELGLTWEM